MQLRLRVDKAHRRRFKKGVPRTYLPRSYLEGFADPDGPEGEPAVWVYRAAAGEWRRTAADRRGSPPRHFNDVADEAHHRAPDLDEALGGVEDEVAALVRGKLARREPLSAPERHAVASFAALLGVRLSSRFAELDEGEARAGWRALAQILGEMGWVFWESPGPLWFITSSSPFLVAFPHREEEMAPSVDIQSPEVEVTLPLTARLALHATWKRSGELWRRAGEDAALEINGRTCQRARAFLVSPRPSVPG